MRSKNKTEKPDSMDINWEQGGLSGRVSQSLKSLRKRPKERWKTVAGVIGVLIFFFLFAVAMTSTPKGSDEETLKSQNALKIVEAPSSRISSIAIASSGSFDYSPPPEEPPAAEAPEPEKEEQKPRSWPKPRAKQPDPEPKPEAPKSIVVFRAPMSKSKPAKNASPSKDDISSKKGRFYKARLLNNLEVASGNNNIIVGEILEGPFKGHRVFGTSYPGLKNRILANFDKLMDPNGHTVSIMGYAFSASRTAGFEASCSKSNTGKALAYLGATALGVGAAFVKGKRSSEFYYYDPGAYARQAVAQNLFREADYWRMAAAASPMICKAPMGRDFLVLIAPK